MLFLARFAVWKGRHGCDCGSLPDDVACLKADILHFHLGSWQTLDPFQKRKVPAKHFSINFKRYQWCYVS